MAETIKFEANVPVTVALAYADGVNVQGRYGPRVMFTLVDGQRMYLDPPVAASIRSQGFRPQQPFQIIKRVGQGGTQWDVNPIEAAPVRRPVQSQAAPQFAVETRGTGTYGPQPVARTIPIAAPAPPTRVPMNVAFGECVEFVNAELKARGEQWNDEARQAAVCTLVIQAGREGWLAPWERGK